MRRNQYYWECPLCHANLDYGEKCDCRSEKNKRERLFKKVTKIDSKTGQLSFQWDGEDGYGKKAVS